MSYDDLLVGGVAVFLSVICTVIALGPWQKPFQLRSVDAIRQRFGMLAARFTWLLLAGALLAAGVTILAGLRPAYATSSLNDVPPLGQWRSIGYSIRETV